MSLEFNESVFKIICYSVGTKDNRLEKKFTCIKNGAYHSNDSIKFTALIFILYSYKIYMIKMAILTKLNAHSFVIK